MLEEALNYAGRGWAVFPLSGYKIPFKGSRGHLDATTDRATIEAWWKARPKANLGLATGDPIAIDLDGPGALATPRGASLKAAADANGGLPPTLTSRTARGLHLFYRPPAGEVIRSSNEPRQAKGADGVDIKGQGGFVVLPPSINAKNGFQYKWQLDLPIAAMPGWLFAWIQGLGAVSSKQNEVTKLGAKPAYLQNNQLVVPRRSVKISAIECSPNELQRIVSALKAIPATSYDTWIEIGLALHSLGWDAPDGGSLGLDIWQRWSATAPEKYNPFEMEARWASFGRTGRAEVGIGTLFHHAGRHGWQQAAPAAVRVDDAVPRGEASRSPAGEDMTGDGMNGRASADHTLPPHFTQAAARAPIQWLDVDHKGRARPTCRNARVAIRHMGLECSHDTFHDRMAIGGQSVAEWAGELTDNTVHMLRITIERVYGLDPGSSSTLDAAVQECLQGGFDPVADYLDGLTWDGVPRLRSWLAVYMGAAQTELNAAIGELMLVAAVRRVRQPGCKFDQILVLEGPEGRGKSSAIEILAGGANFSDQTILTLDDKGQQEAIGGVWLYEIADLAGMSKADTEKVKAFCSRTRDRARPAYGRTRQDKPRRCVFIATTNHETFLKSQTGNRRFWPVRTGHVDLEALRRDRDQLWAEASAIEARGASLFLPERLWGAAGALQDERRDHDPWEDVLAAMTEGGKIDSAVKLKQSPDGRGMEHRITTRDVLEIVLRLPPERTTDVTAKRVAFIMRRLGWDGPKVMRDGDDVFKGYRRAAGLAHVTGNTTNGVTS